MATWRNDIATLQKADTLDECVSIVSQSGKIIVLTGYQDVGIV